MNVYSMMSREWHFLQRNPHAPAQIHQTEMTRGCKLIKAPPTLLLLGLPT